MELSKNFSTDSKHEELVYKKHAQQFYTYKLKGIVIHTGSADAGHYYSYIKTKSNNQEEKWLEFNDMKVVDFKASDIETECFGGK